MNEPYRSLILLFGWMIATGLIIDYIMRGGVLLALASFCIYTAIGMVQLEDGQDDSAQRGGIS